MAAPHFSPAPLMTVTWVCIPLFLPQSCIKVQREHRQRYKKKRASEFPSGRGPSLMTSLVSWVINCLNAETTASARAVGARLDSGRLVGRVLLKLDAERRWPRSLL